MKQKQYLAVFLSLAMLMAGCAGTENSGSSQSTDTAQEEPFSGAEESTEENSNSSAVAESISLSASELFSDRDFEVGYDESGSAVISFNGETAACSSDAVQITDSTVTITDEGTYILSGNLDDGMVIVNAEKTDKIQLVLNGVTIHSETSAPIYVLQADKVFLTMTADSQNSLSNGGSFTAIDDNNIDAVIYSKDDLTLKGSGMLTISSPGGHGIVSKDSLTITSGTYEISCAFHGLTGKDDICIADGTFTISSGKDGIHAENADDFSLGYVFIQNGTFNLTAEGDGVSAASVLQIKDGDFQITSGGGSENAEARSSQSWGAFPGGGKNFGGMSPEGGKSFEGMPTENNGERPQERGEGMRGGSGNMPSDRDPGMMPNDEMEMPDNNAMEPVDSENPAELPATAETTEADTESTSMKGMKAGGNLTIGGGSFVIDSADDGVHTNGSLTIESGSFTISSGDDGFHADETLAVADGSIQITESYEGLEGLHVNISGGTIDLTASDDGLNAAGGADASGAGGRDGRFGGGMSFGGSEGSILISGGTIQITAGADGIDANGSLEITGGYVCVTGPTQGDTSILDYDTSAIISGGTFVGSGASSMAQTFSDSGQGVIAAKVSSRNAGTEIQVKDSVGNILITFTPELAYDFIIISSPELAKGESYTITMGTSAEEYSAG